MFKGFQNTSRNKGFNGFPALNFQMNNEAYGFSGCSFWLDAALYVNNGNPADGAAVSSWTDKIRGIRFFNNTAAQQLIYNASNPNFNNLPTIQNTTYVTKKLVASNQVNVKTSATIAIVYKNDNLTNTVPYLLTNDIYSFISTGGTLSVITGVGVYGVYGSISTALLVSTVEDLSPHIVIITNNKIYVDGVSVSTTGTWNTPSSFNSIGGDGSQNGSIIGRIAEIVLFDFTMTDDQCSQLSTRLNSKYAIY